MILAADAGLYFVLPAPPNRGEITVEEFAENYNFYARNIIKMISGTKTERRRGMGGCFHRHRVSVSGVFPMAGFYL